MQRGELNLLRLMLMRCFGELSPSIEERLEHATNADIEHWAGRLFDAASVEDV